MSDDLESDSVAANIDVDEQMARLVEKREVLVAYYHHPVTVELLADNEEEQQGLIDLICEAPVRDFETFFTHFTALGHLRGLRRVKTLLQANLDEVNHEINQLKPLKQ